MPRPGYTRVVLKHPWQGYAVGDAVDVTDGVANLLVERMKIAAYMAPSRKKATNGQEKAQRKNGSRKKRRTKK